MEEPKNPCIFVRQPAGLHLLPDNLTPWTTKALQDSGFWETVDGAPEDAQRAIFAFHTWLCRVGRYKIYILLEW
jgi:hypothetical protein